MSSGCLFPEEIMVDILSRLPVKSIKRFRCVCKPWCDLFSSPNFTKMHLNHHAVEKENISLLLIRHNKIYSIDCYDSLSSSSSSSSTSTCYEASEIDLPFKSSKYNVVILGSCNGLVCMIPDEGVICFWNPSTREYNMLPKPITFKFPTNDLDIMNTTFGFGYDCNTDDYKLVIVMSFGDGRRGCGCVAQVYSLHSNSWKIINDTPNFTLYKQFGRFVNGALHWIGMRCMDSRGYEGLVSFDLGDDTFKEVPQLQHFESEFLKKISVSGTCLYMLVDDVFDTHLDVWVMKEYGVKESWVKLFTIPQQSLIPSFLNLWPVQSLRNGEILLDVNVGEALVLYDPNHERARTLKICGVPKKFYTEAYIESLVSPGT